MKRNLVVASSTHVREIVGVDNDAALELAVAAEKQRLQAYLYGSATLVAFVSTVESYSANEKRVACRALVTVEGHDAANARYLADYQSGRLQSGSFGVIDYVEDENGAREHVGLVEAPEPTLKDALEYAASCLREECVLGSLGLDFEFVEGRIVVENGVEREYTEDDLARDLAKHNAFIAMLQDAANNLFE